MTISTSESEVTLLGNASTVTFEFPFVGVSASDIAVLYNNGTSTVTLDPSQYTLFLNPAAPGELWGVGGTVTYPTSGSPIASGTSVTIMRTLPLTQTEEVADQGNFYPAVIERGLDILEMQIQQIAARTGKWRGTWATNTAYGYADLVVDGPAGSNSGNIYMCINANTSGVWANDLAAGDWVLAVQAVLGTVPLPLSVANGGTGVTSLAALIAALGLGSAALENLSSVIKDNGSGALTIGNNQVTNAMLAQGPGLSVKGVAGTATANEGDITLSATNLLGVNSGGTALGAITLGSNLSMSGNVLSATGGGGGGGSVSVVQVLNCGYTVADTTTLLTPSFNTWGTAPLNTTQQNSVTGASRSGSVITLPVGKYMFWADMTVTNTTANLPLELRLRNTTAGATIPGSVRGISTGSNGIGFLTGVFGYYEVSGSPITVELQYFISKSSGTSIGVNKALGGVNGNETINWATVQFVLLNGSGIFVESDTSVVSGSTQIKNVIALTQAEYNGIGSPDANTLYVIDG